MPERLSPLLQAALARCERPAHAVPEDHEPLLQLVAMRLVTTRRDHSGQLVYRLTTIGERALETGWY